MITGKDVNKKLSALYEQKGLLAGAGARKPTTFVPPPSEPEKEEAPPVEEERTGRKNVWTTYHF